MHRPSLSRLLSIAGLSLLIGCAYPSLSINPTESTAQAQTSASVMMLSQLEAILNAESTNVGSPISYSSA